MRTPFEDDQIRKELMKRLGLKRDEQKGSRDLDSLKDRLGLNVKGDGRRRESGLEQKRKNRMSRTEKTITTFTCDRCKASQEESDFNEDAIPEWWIEVGDLCVGKGRGERDHTDELWCGRCVESFCEWFQNPPAIEADPKPQELHG